jgi:hypothetical protein
MTSDHFLKFPTESAMLDALRPLGMTYTEPTEDGADLVEHASQGSHQFALHEVGEIPGLDGWHVNLRVIDPELDVSSLEPFAVHPRNPVNVWA